MAAAKGSAIGGAKQFMGKKDATFTGMSAVHSYQSNNKRSSGKKKKTLTASLKKRDNNYHSTSTNQNPFNSPTSLPS